MNTVKTLSHQEAIRIIGAIQMKAEAEGHGLAVAVVDAHGELIAFLRTDGCRLPSITIAQNKAYAAAREQIESKELGNRSKSEGFPMTTFGVLTYPTWGGGVPIFSDGQIVGAVGVSGLPESVDIEYAKHGIEAIS
jgi:glc operon protein GlcG